MPLLLFTNALPAWPYKRPYAQQNEAQHKGRVSSFSFALPACWMLDASRWAHHPPAPTPRSAYLSLTTSRLRRIALFPEKQIALVLVTNNRPKVLNTLAMSAVVRGSDSPRLVADKIAACGESTRSGACFPGQDIPQQRAGYRQPMAATSTLFRPTAALRTHTKYWAYGTVRMCIRGRA
jgi:hypothetical protein